MSACEIYEALSAILWEVSRQRAPIFFRDHFLIVFLQQLIVQSWTQSKREWCGRCFLNCELIFGRRLSFLNQTSILSVLHLIGGNFVVTHQHWFGGSIMIKGSRLFQLFVHILLFAAFEAGTTHFHSIHLSLWRKGFQSTKQRIEWEKDRLTSSQWYACHESVPGKGLFRKMCQTLNYKVNFGWYIW